MKYRAPRGTRDILPEECRKWHFLEEKIREVSWKYGYGEIRVPIFDSTEVFARSVGEDTDIVSKEMYTFTDRGERSLTLRPEGTASVVRAYLENNLNAGPGPVKLYYYGPMFRYDRPQAGRYRQFYQYGVECFGSGHPAADAEVIKLTLDLLGMLGLEDVTLQINSVGCSECRPVYRRKLKEVLEHNREKLCRDCTGRLESSPMRIMDCKEEHCREATVNAPVMVDHLCPECSAHYAEVKEILNRLGIVGEENPRLVRGLDYYTRTAFEFVSTELGAQDSIGGGGRYDNLVEHMGGPTVPAVGVALGIERLLLSMDKTFLQQKKAPAVFVAVSSDDQLPTGFQAADIARKAGCTVEVELMGRSLKAQMKYAGKKGFDYVLITGQEEETRGIVTLRDMNTGQQEELPVSRLESDLQSVVKQTRNRKEEG